MSNPTTANIDPRGVRELLLQGDETQYLKQLNKANGWIFSAWLIGHLAVCAIMIWLIIITDHVAIKVLLSILLASQLHALTILQHDCGHQNAYRTKWANLWIGRLLAWMIFLPFTSFTELHKRHHTHTGDPQHDPDEWFYAGGSKQLLLREFFFVPRFIIESLGSRLPPVLRRRVLRELIGHIIIYTGLLGAAWYFDFFQPVLYGLLIPVAILALIINPISRGYEHYPITLMARDNPKRRQLKHNTVTIRNPVFSLLWANITYHVEHHLYPGVPFYRLPKLHRLLRNRSYIVEPYPLYRWFNRNKDESIETYNGASEHVALHKSS